jgi:hypothetical protein
MAEGFLLDTSQQSGRLTHWVEGAPEYYWLKILKLRGRRRHPIESWRCASCGFLESYAPGADAAGRG